MIHDMGDIGGTQQRQEFDRDQLAEFPLPTRIETCVQLYYRSWPRRRVLEALEDMGHMPFEEGADFAGGGERWSVGA